jgi:hypothetical protein
MTYHQPIAPAIIRDYFADVGDAVQILAAANITLAGQLFDAALAVRRFTLAGQIAALAHPMWSSIADLVFGKPDLTDLDGPITTRPPREDPCP